MWTLKTYLPLWFDSEGVSSIACAWDSAHIAHVMRVWCKSSTYDPNPTPKQINTHVMLDLHKETEAFGQHQLNRRLEILRQSEGC